LVVDERLIEQSIMQNKEMRWKQTTANYKN
jgi:hypothetical protein